MAKKTTEIAVAPKPGALVVADLGGYAGLGLEGVTKEELVIPFLSLLQDLSPQVKGTTKIPGAEVGMLYNTATEEILEPNARDEVIFVPVARERCYMEWVPRKKGGGLVARHAPESQIVAQAKESSTEFGKFATPAGNDLVETFYVYGILITNGDPSPICISFTGTKIKVWKKYFTGLTYVLVQTPDGERKQPPLFAHRIRLGSKDDKNKSGQEFKNITLRPAKGTVKESMVLDPTDEVFQSAAGLQEMIRSGTARADFESERAAGPEASEDGDSDGVF